MSRQQRAQIAQETVSLLETGEYRLPDGQLVSIRDPLASACAGTVLYRPADYDALLAQIAPLPRHPAPTIAVSNQTTLAAACTLVDSYAGVACLNFASAKNPGGGFLSSSQAQEESLARASGLYATLQTQPDFYTHHRYLGTSLYSDHAIFSPDVPVFRDDDDRLLATPWATAFITAAAVNAGAVRQNEPKRVSLIVPTMEQRTRIVLAIAARHQCEAVVLGAWGCGVFQNDPVVIASIFAAALAEPSFQGRFRHIEFAVYDRMQAQATIAAFSWAFG
jgi:uncharacterized protein (TIGR02452 family)